MGSVIHSMALEALPQNVVGSEIDCSVLVAGRFRAGGEHGAGALEERAGFGGAAGLGEEKAAEQVGLGAARSVDGRGVAGAHFLRECADRQAALARSPPHGHPT